MPSTLFCIPLIALVIYLPGISCAQQVFQWSVQAIEYKSWKLQICVKHMLHLYRRQLTFLSFSGNWLTHRQPQPSWKLHMRHGVMTSPIAAPDTAQHKFFFSESSDDNFRMLGLPQEQTSCASPTSIGVNHTFFSLSCSHEINKNPFQPIRALISNRRSFECSKSTVELTSLAMLSQSTGLPHPALHIRTDWTLMVWGWLRIVILFTSL